MVTFTEEILNEKLHVLCSAPLDRHVVIAPKFTAKVKVNKTKHRTICGVLLLNCGFKMRIYQNDQIPINTIAIPNAIALSQKKKYIYIYIYMLKISNRNTTIRNEISSKLTKKTPE